MSGKQGERWRDYWTSCAQLLYWSYFKPFTLAQHLRSIHPDLEPDSNPFRLRRDFVDIPALARYARQVAHLTQIIPILTVLIVGCLYTFAGQRFAWLDAFAFVLAFASSVRIVTRPDSEKTAQWRTRVLLLVSGSIFLFVLLQRFVPQMAYSLIEPLYILLANLPIDLTPWLFDLYRVAVGVAMIVGSLRLFVWPFEVIWMFVLWLTMRNERAGQALHRLPIYYDEFIVLPLPLLGEFLAEAYRYNQAGARQAIDYLTTHSRQQAAAQQAQVMIALDRLLRCEHTDDIAAISDELRWIAQPPPPELGATLPALLDVSQGVRAADEATSRFRQRQALEQQIEQLRILREGLVTGSPRHASHYGAIIDRWHAIVTGAVRTLEQTLNEDGEIPLVYIAGGHLRPNEAQKLFKGRSDIFREVESILLAPRPPVLMLEGQRRTGKTSLIAYLPQRLPAEIVPVRVNVQGAASVETNAGLAYTIAQGIVDSARWGRNLVLPSPGLAEFRIDPFLALSDWLSQAERTAKNRNFLLCLDEFQRFDEVITSTGSRHILNFLRDFIEHRRRWSLLLARSVAAEEMAPYWSDTLISARLLHISYLDIEEARELIEQPVPGFEQHMRYDSDAVETILHLSRGQPYLVQLLCTELVNHLNRSHRRTATITDVDAVLNSTLHRGNFFTDIWDSATPAEQSILLKVASGSTTAGASQTLKKLVSRELLEPIDGDVRFQIPLVKTWFQRKARELTATGSDVMASEAAKD